MKWFYILALTTLILLGGVVKSVAGDFKVAPKPHYTEAAGYGWDTKVPVDKPKNVWNILKVWATRETKSVFLDKNKDGQCDVVLNFMATGEYDDQSRALYMQVPETTCAWTEFKVIEFLAGKQE